MSYIRLWIVRVLMLSLTVSLCPAGAADAKDLLRIGSWNIENLGERNFGQNQFAIAEYLQLSGVDVLALQEIHDTDGSGAPYRNGRLDQVVALLNEQHEAEWKYQLFPKRDEDETKQLCGLLWNEKRVKKIGEPLRVPLDHEHGTLWDRHPYAVKFQAAGTGKSDFVLISVHMKSNVSNPGDALTPVERRAHEAEALADALEGVSSHFQDEDIVILGDTNCLNGNEAALQTFTGIGLRDLNAKATPTYVSGGPFDHIFVPNAQLEFRFSRQYLLAPADTVAHDKALSDHMMILMTMQVLADDDVPGGGDSPTSAPTANQYYTSINGSLSGPALKTALHDLIRQQRRLSYDGLWDALGYTDESETDSTKVVLIYTGWLRPKQDHGGGPSQWNREHVWAKSKGDFGISPGAGTDLHHIRPEDVTVNSARGSLSFDEGGNPYHDPDGQTQNRHDDDSWEPRTEVRGDVARMLLYMAVRYEDADLDLELVDTAEPEGSHAPRIGRLSALLKWHNDDPPSQFEKRRNNRIHERQGNRNPFIDHPEWVQKLWPQP